MIPITQFALEFVQQLDDGPFPDTEQLIDFYSDCLAEIDAPKTPKSLFLEFERQVKELIGRIKR
jgi:hypothetical protein